MKIEIIVCIYIYMSYHIMSCHIISYHIISYHIYIIVFGLIMYMSTYNAYVYIYNTYIYIYIYSKKLHCLGPKEIAQPEGSPLTHCRV